MGWDANITSSKPITEEDVQKIVDNLPEHFSRFGNPKQSWGWSSYADIMTPGSNGLHISDSCSISGSGAESFVNHISNELRALGYHDVNSEFY